MIGRPNMQTVVTTGRAATPTPSDPVGRAAAAAGGAQDQADTHAVLAGLPAAEYPHSAATVDHLYEPDLTAQFDHGLRLLLAGLRMQLPAGKHRPG